MAQRLADLYPDSTHVHLAGLDRVPDIAVWNYARDQGYVIVTHDSDFNDLSAVLGFPPKVVWIRRGNCSTREIEAILRVYRDSVLELVRDTNSGILALL